MRFLTIIFIFLASCSLPGTEAEKDQTIDLAYMGWACDCDCKCAIWATQEDVKKFGDNTDTLVKLSVFLLPADSTLHLPDTLGRPGDVIRLTGKFDKEEGLPENIDYGDLKPEKARIFRFTRYEIVERDYHLYWKTPDTMMIDKRSAVFYTPDSLQMERRIQQIGEDTFRMGMGDYLQIMNEAATYLESAKLPLVFANEKRLLIFKNEKGLVQMINTDTLPDMWGIYLFDPSRQSKFIDIGEAEKEYKAYFK
jgi:hypothetical protein